ncbi:L,D-transpeptidase family protein [Flavobacterium frigoris]|uniref:Murein L,D-transpeptidase YcbB/YkuD n=1 Tax=Flavobacterium frigoris TaxID=229204 RepID=A0A1H9NQN3_FLAFI|nr:L,D-transpeptidase family protein [Flavobacterium frigoris]SER38211.1 Murein L,D-transpeptidase YcbB/YkuD [Flavobacterium frigoris]
MKNFFLSIVVVLFGFSLAAFYHYRNDDIPAKMISIVKIFQTTPDEKLAIPIDKTILKVFFEKYPDLKKYESDVVTLYKNRNYNSIWYDNKGLIEFADMLYSKVNSLEEEGLKSTLAYASIINGIFNANTSNKISETDTEILLTTVYVYYAKKVFQGIDVAKTTDIGWFLPRKNISYDNLLDSLLTDPQLLSKNEKQLFTQYYKLRDVLKKYRAIEQSGDWDPIDIDPSIEYYKHNDSSKTIGQIRHHLAVMGDLKRDSKSNLYDEELMEGVMNFKKRNGYKTNKILSTWQAQRMNIPIEKLISTIIVNMERCRWIDPKFTKVPEYIFINIPAFKLNYIKNGKKELESNLLVGKDMTETVVFSGSISSIVFSPYWTVPRSIIENEIKQAIFQDKNYLESHEMEWKNGNIIQRPGVKNPMGLVKFMFPNSNDIYLHDTPYKSLFEFDYRAFSHGCINMDKGKELAILLLRDDPNWTVASINEAMKGEKQTIHVLKNKIPIYIGYFTAWVSDDGVINFYNDLYQRDDRLADLLFSDVTE